MNLNEIPAGFHALSEERLHSIMERVADGGGPDESHNIGSAFVHRLTVDDGKHIWVHCGAEPSANYLIKSP